MLHPGCAQLAPIHSWGWSQVVRLTAHSTEGQPAHWLTRAFLASLGRIAFKFLPEADYTVGAHEYWQHTCMSVRLTVLGAAPVGLIRCGLVRPATNRRHRSFQNIPPGKLRYLQRLVVMLSAHYTRGAPALSTPLAWIPVTWLKLAVARALDDQSLYQLSCVRVGQHAVPAHRLPHCIPILTVASNVRIVRRPHTGIEHNS